jgi:hypothetical protein
MIFLLKSKLIIISLMKQQKEEFVKTLRSFIKKLELRRVVTIFLASVLLIVSTACSGANAQGANPENPAVQAGGANNPYKNGGDKYTNLRMSTDPKINNTGRDQSSLPLNSQLLVANNKESELLYPGAETPEGRIYKEQELPRKTLKDFEKPEAGGLIQHEPDVGTRVTKRIDIVKDAVQEASKFLQDKADEASSRPELQKNPSVGK